MDKIKAIEIATHVVENALNYFKANKNIGAYTTLRKQTELVNGIKWLKSYCEKKEIDIQQFV